MRTGGIATTGVKAVMGDDILHCDSTWSWYSDSGRKLVLPSMDS